MSLDYALVTGGIFIGIGATLLIDTWNILLKHFFNISSLNFCLLGRWILFMADGKFLHTQIARAEAKPAECITGWTVHYLVGILFGLVFVYSITEWWANPSLLPAVMFGLITVALPFFIMQPALGFGIAASKMPNPLQAQLKSLVTHLLFGCGLYISALVLK